jgi:heme exporter protein D
MGAYLHFLWPAVQSALVILMIVFLLRVHRQLNRLREGRSEAQRWLTEFIQTTNRLRETFSEMKERMVRLETDLAAAESRIGQILRAEQRRGADRAWAEAVRGGTAATPAALRPDTAAPPPGSAAPSPPVEPPGQNWQARLAQLK